MATELKIRVGDKSGNGNGHSDPLFCKEVAKCMQGLPTNIPAAGICQKENNPWKGEKTSGITCDLTMLV